MAAIAGWLIPGWAPTERAPLRRAVAGPSGVGDEPREVLTEGAGALACAATVEHDPDSGLVALITGRPRWLDPATAATATAHGDGAALLQAYTRFGTEVPTHVTGELALAVIDPRRRSVFAATDRLGRHPLYYARTGSGIVIGSTAEAVTAHPLVATRLSLQGLYDYIYFHMVPAPRTIHEGVAKLPAASCLEYRDGTAATRRYWVPSFQEATDASPEGAAGELRGAIRTAVRRHTDRGGAVGAFLSGGLDSSTVAGMLAEATSGEAATFSIGFHADGYDELPYARTVARHFGTRSHEYYVTPADVAETLVRVATAYDEPFGNSSALPAYFCARAAADAGVTTLLAGDGGDELFAGNERYAKQQLFERYRMVPRAVRNQLLEPALSTRAARLPGLRKLRSYVEQARTPLPERMQSYNFLHRIAPETVFTPEFLEQVDPSAPLRHQRELYETPEAPTSALNRMMYLDWQLTLADNDLRKVTGMSELAGVEAVFPMLDEDVVALSTRIPSDWKLPRGRLRGFYKDAFRGWLPDQTLAKTKHGFGLPFGVWLTSEPALREVAGDGIAALRGHGWFTAEFLDGLLDARVREHAAYYGDLAWILAVLGHWEHARRPTGAGWAPQ